MVAFSDKEKTEVLTIFFSKISNIGDIGQSLPKLYALCNHSLDDILIKEQEVTDIISISLNTKLLDTIV